MNRYQNSFSTAPSPNGKHRRRMAAFRAEQTNEANRLANACPPDLIRELGFLGLARRLLQAKFYHFPAYTNEELAAILDVSPTQISALMTRKTYCTGSLFELISSRLRKLEEDESLPAIAHPEPSDWQT